QERLMTDGRVEGPGRVVKKRIITVCRVRVTAGVVTERSKAGGSVEVPGRVVKKRVITVCRVRVTAGVVTECSKPGGSVGAASSIVKEGKHSNGCVVLACRIIQKGSGASGGIVFAGVEEKRPGTDSRVEVAGAVALKRKPSSRCIVCAASEV